MKLLPSKFMIFATVLSTALFGAGCEYEDPSGKPDERYDADFRVYEVGGVNYKIPRLGLSVSYNGKNKKFVRKSPDGKYAFFEGGDSLTITGCCPDSIVEVYPEAATIEIGLTLSISTRSRSSRVYSNPPPQELAGLPEYNEHFLYFENKVTGKRRPPEELVGQEIDPTGYSLVSKEPLIFGRRVAVNCAGPCYWTTVPGNLPDAYPPHISSAPRVNDADEKIAYIRNQPEGLKKIENLVNLLQFDVDQKEADQ